MNIFIGVLYGDCVSKLCEDEVHGKADQLVSFNIFKKNIFF